MVVYMDVVVGGEVLGVGGMEATYLDVGKGPSNGRPHPLVVREVVACSHPLVARREGG